MAALTWSKANSYRWNCNEIPGVCISAAKSEGVPVYTLWQASEAMRYTKNVKECKAMAEDLR